MDSSRSAHRAVIQFLLTEGEHTSQIYCMMKEVYGEQCPYGALYSGGGSTAVPSGFPEAYYHGFRGCISSITIDTESLNLSRGYSDYCQPS
ncbi:hypothetical protein AVEN_87486-1 [Araneus ventricosus]|uniref:Uncharacterized protein n=1 Tax=Araneus ventricosus TaxID=182803 RepID=A0A4Y2RBX8_ARAVE|nr:hypothetical protein AVEN_275391-1 [Araneus ventricosus]GBN73274.1 hypothetical protein AVEN_87486-1 [Araneus ventricosus]